jgi:abhydrolase domain-containing protein 12
MLLPSPAIATITILAGTFGLYFAFIGLLTIPYLQNQVIYLNSVKLTWFKDVNVPEQWGFLRNQVMPFKLQTPDDETLHAWHVLPLGLYQEHEQELVEEYSGLVSDVSQRLGFRLLRDDPDALLVLYFHGAAGTLGSGFRPPSYRAMSAGSPRNIHTVAIDYRGFGTSSGSPSEEGLLTDALTLADWAMKEAGIPASRIAIFSQSLGTAVAISLIHHLATRPDPTFFSGVVLVAPFANVEQLTATYRIAGTIPLLDPIARFPKLLAFFNRFIVTKWPSKDRLADFVRTVGGMTENEDARYHITIIHAEDDYDIPWPHSDQVFWHAVNAAGTSDISFEELEKQKLETRQVLGDGGWVVSRETEKGLIREEITRYGLHDRIMSYPIVSRAVSRAFQRI